MRRIVLDTETTGLEPSQGHRIIEIGCVELVNRRLTNNNFHQYIKPERDIDEGAQEVHGITLEFLNDKPVMADVVEDFVNYIRGAELIIHNAPFDVGFLNKEFELYAKATKTRTYKIEELCTVLDTLALARKMHPGQKNSLDALCKRYHIDNSSRTLHGALLDAEILADTYLAMTGGQGSLSLGGESESADGITTIKQVKVSTDRPTLKVIRANSDELDAHQKRLADLDKASDGQCVWNYE
ncbi:DNA polymerase III epsilon subunit [hydrothermal vent metagenome]|uniref:DNA polymerase III subunit epsilon n=1 Tax=hydrothermal vent metagenome TaxID=652676 RepID=A0A3B0ZYM1_9ZZZZ